MAMDYNKVSLDTQEQLMEDAKAKARANAQALQNKKLLEEQEEQIRNLLLLNNLQDPRNAAEDPRKARKEYTHFEDELPAAEDLMALMNDPEAVKALAEQYRNTTNPPMDTSDLSEEASKEMNGYVPGEAGYGRKLYAEQIHRGYKGTDIHDKNNIPSGLPINPSGVVTYDAVNDPVLRNIFPVNGVMSDESKQFRANNQSREGSKPTATIVNDKKLDSIKDNFVPPMAKEEQTVASAKAKAAELTSTPMPVVNNDPAMEQPSEQNAEESEQDLSDLPWPVRVVTPKINEALKVLADQDPNILQLPEIKALIKRSQAGYDKQRALSTVAAFTSNPQMWMDQANKFREEGDKNLIDAAENLEKLRDRKLQATKAVADNLAAQKSTFASMYGNAYNAFANGIAQLPVVYEAAREADAEADKIHHVGDENLKAANTSFDMFLSAAESLITTDKKRRAQGLALLENIRKERAKRGGAQVEWYSHVDPSTKQPMAGYIDMLGQLEKYILQNKIPEFRAQTKDMTDNIANYGAAMAAEKQARTRAESNRTRADQMFNIYSDFANKHRIPFNGLMIQPFNVDEGDDKNTYAPGTSGGGNATVKVPNRNQKRTGAPKPNEEIEVPIPEGQPGGSEEIIVDESSSSSAPASSSSSRHRPPRSSSSAGPTSSSSAIPFSSSSASPSSSSSSAQLSNGGKAKLASIEKTLKAFRAAGYDATSLNNMMSETSGTLADLGKAKEQKAFLNAKNALTKLATDALKDEVSARVLKELLNGDYAEEVNAILPSNAGYGRLKDRVRTQPNLPDLSYKGNEALQRQKEILDSLAPVLSSLV